MAWVMKVNGEKMTDSPLISSVTLTEGSNFLKFSTSVFYINETYPIILYHA